MLVCINVSMYVHVHVTEYKAGCLQSLRWIINEHTTNLCLPFIVLCCHMHFLNVVVMLKTIKTGVFFCIRFCPPVC